MVVIDDPVSILRCTNKIYLHDLLKSKKLPTPRTEIVFRDDAKRLAALPEVLGLPIVLKIPDGSFSRGIIKAETAQQLAHAADELFQHTALLLAQEYMYTEFDWRIGILNGQALYRLPVLHVARPLADLRSLGQGQSQGSAPSRAASRPCRSAKRPAKW
jgi:glutathione synthase/RimK-type ligase-like ATP-grasp enzyme